MYKASNELLDFPCLSLEDQLGKLTVTTIVVRWDCDRPIGSSDLPGRLMVNKSTEVPRPPAPWNDAVCG